jgi:threonine/homoserine/homoserine lactone efflux protein
MPDDIPHLTPGMWLYAIVMFAPVAWLGYLGVRSWWSGVRGRREARREAGRGFEVTTRRDEVR